MRKTAKPRNRSVVFESLESRQLMSATIAFFDDPKYVNTATGSDANDLLQQIESYGTYTVKTFVGTTSAAFTAGLSGANLLVIPALDNGDLNAVLTNSTKGEITGFLSAGGGLLLTGTSSSNTINLLNNTFTWQLGNGWQGGVYSLQTATGTKFSGGSPAINENTGDYAISNLPTGATRIYNDFNENYGEGDAVSLLPFGKTTPIVYLSWDFANGGPNGTQDGGWNAVLNEAIQQVQGNVTPSAPNSLVATPLNQTTVNLSWKGSTTNVTGFTVQQAKAAAGPWTTVGTTAVGVTTFSNTKLTASTAYYYRVYATGPYGSSGYTSTATTTTASNVFATLTSGKLVITGTNDSDSIYLTLSGGTLTVTETNAGASLKTTFANASVKSITITDTTGNNSIGIGAGIIAASITTGSGNDVFGLLNVAADSVNGGGGNDVLFGTTKDVVKNVKTVVL